MSDEIFQQAYRFVLYGDSPRPGKAKLWRGEQGKHLPTLADPNPTLDGVIQTTYDEFRDRLGLERRSVFLMEPAERESIYRDFWHQSHAGKIEAMGKGKLALAHFTTVFNFGFASREPGKILQRSVSGQPKLVIDGVIGPKTLDAIAACDDTQASVRYCGNLVRAYKAEASDGGAHDRHAPNLKGWLLRVEAIQREIGLV